MSRTTLREAVILLAVSLLLGLMYNAVVGKGLFGPSDPATAPLTNETTLPSTEIISLQQAHDLHEEARALFVDTRHGFDFQLEHIPGAVNIPLDDARTVIPVLGEAKDRTIVLYCDGTECNSSLEVGSLFLMNGYSDVRVFYGGWKAWKEMGYPTESSGR